MANDIILNAATVAGGKTVATEDIGGVQFQRVKLALGSSGQDLGDVSGTNPLVVDMGGASIGAFGDLITSENTPVVQVNFVYGINSQQGVTDIVTTGVADTSSARLRLQTGTGAGGAARFISKKVAIYRAGQGMTTRFTVAFATGVASSTQVAGFGTATNGYFFGFNGITFGVLHRNAGVDTWVGQTAWNGDKCNGTGVSGFTIDPTKGNVFQIRYPYLGYGVINFWMLDATTGRWILAHTIRYPNTTASTQLSNPALRFYVQAINSGNTTNLIMYSGSAAALLTGQLALSGNPKFAYDNNKAAITTETVIFALKSATTYNGVTNESTVRLTSLSFAGGGNASNNAVVRLKIGATLGGVATYAAVDGTTADNGVTVTSGNSVVSANTVHTTVAGGRMVFSMSVNNADSGVLDLRPYDIVLYPGEVLTVSGFATATSQISASLTWSEDT